MFLIFLLYCRDGEPIVKYDSLVNILISCEIYIFLLFNLAVAYLAIMLIYSCEFIFYNF